MKYDAVIKTVSCQLIQGSKISSIVEVQVHFGDIVMVWTYGANM